MCRFLKGESAAGTHQLDTFIALRTDNFIANNDNTERRKTEENVLKGQHAHPAWWPDPGKAHCGCGAHLGSGVFLAAAQSELVKQVLCQACFWGPRLAKVAQVITQLFDGLDLLVQEVALQEVAQLRGHLSPWSAGAAPGGSG